MSHGRITQLFLRARELSGGERDAFLDHACSGDGALREELDSLLAHDHALASTEHPASAGDVNRFLPGTVLAGRYRIVALLGRGGMGEVYRADDLTLGQPVALKFVAQVAGDPQRLHDRMLNEVRLARTVTHPNVCRVFDVGQADGQLFFSMELVDGEDLGTLLRRIGRLPRDKGLELARQIVAGVAAAHERGILHRDLKPANIMIDGRGRAKITDFGLAALPEEIVGREAGFGTRAYMAPEQLDCREITVRTDLYALGLVLYELFTGQRAFPASSVEELRLAQERSTPLLPSSLVPGLDPAVERVLLSCVAASPRDRPSSALALLAELPGADPLSAALAAGETPSPELVAAAQAETGLTKTVGLLCLAATVLGLLLLAALSRGTMLFADQPLDLPPEVLAHRAREVLAAFDLRATPGDSAHGFGIDARTLAEAHSGPFPALYFWYRESPAPLRAARGNVSLASPAALTPGMTSVVLHTDGRLLELHAIPAAPGSPGLPDFGAVFELAGLDLAAFRDEGAAAVPPLPCDACRTWVEEASALRVRAGALGDRLTYFHALPPWRDSLLAQPPESWQRAGVFGGLFDALYIALVIACTLAARRQLKLGRGDRRGATRLAVYVFGTSVGLALLAAHHVASFSGEREVLAGIVARALLTAIFLCWVPYVALEPPLRRAWPHRIISWTRLLSGRLRDPLVGRDLLLGVLTAVVTQLLLRVSVLAPVWLGRPAPRLQAFWPETLLGVRHVLGALLRLQHTAVFFGLGLLFLLLAFRSLTRSPWIAAALVVLLATLAWHPEIAAAEPQVGLVVTALRIGLFVAVMLRFGVLAGIVAMSFDGAFNVLPLTLDPSAWYIGSSLLALFAAVGVAAWGLRHALAPRFSAWT